MPEDAKIQCRACGGTLRPIYEFVAAFLEDFRKMLGQEPKKSDKWVCINCYLIYESDYNNTEFKCEWGEALKKYYEK
jgi:hypothetical protein